MNDPIPTDDQQRRPRRVYWILLAITVSLVAALAGAATAGFGRHGGHGWHRGGHGDPEAMREHMGFALDFGLRKLNATEEQQAAIQAIADRTFESMLARHADRERVHIVLRSLIESDEIDRAALEELRTSQLAEFDEASQELVVAAADALEVLTLEQRQQLVAHFDEHRSRRR